MKNITVITIAILLSGCTHLGKRHPASNDLGQIGDSENLSQLIRSNSKHYWSWVKGNKDKYSEAKDAAKFKGYIFGDPHMGNFAPTLVKDTAGKQRMKFVPVDFDDVGVAPFIFDLARYIVASEAVDKKSIKKSAIIEAYIEGLNNPDADLSDRLPDVVQSKLSMKVKDVLALQDKMVDKKTKDGKIKIEKNETEKYDGKLTDAIKKTLAPAKLEDVARRIVLRGGSKDALRLWALTKNDKHGIIHEFKEWEQTGIDAYEKQSSIGERLNDIYEIFWPGLDSSTYTVVSLDGELFWLREKQESLLDIPYTVNSDPEREFVASYSAACAMALGQIHGRQSAGQDFAKFIGKKLKADGLKDIVEPIAKDYLELVEEQFKK